jgi:hypothetical protein
MLKWTLVYFAHALGADVPILEALYMSMTSEPLESLWQFHLDVHNPSPSLAKRLVECRWVVVTDDGKQIGARNKNGREDIYHSNNSKGIWNILIVIDRGHELSRFLALDFIFQVQVGDTLVGVWTYEGVQHPMETRGASGWMYKGAIPLETLSTAIWKCIPFMRNNTIKSYWQVVLQRNGS